MFAELMAGKGGLFSYAIFKQEKKFLAVAF
jgi:hypothetical protein